ncbi:CYTH and CHAD domain-containing protein [Herbaspirillum sp. C7C8]|uniref:CYTH and CHAD domain-containing protein n=1 Tax=Herbaspirillum sp. C7C8 TaxID=2736665 RepID=UPI001F520581|nr:CYTH and CHAD domain-containing protein [Herbaspirillum sp. C7C8]MCI1004196.1 CYTH and CHAD domain-containing protein [Herbaspirillum sp. C7C8]
METELKLLLAPEHTKAFIRHPLIKRHAQAAPRIKDQTGTYFDTPDLLLRQNEAGLRVRRTGNEFVQTLKAGGGVHGGLHQRNEWESLVEGDAPDLPVLRDLVASDDDWARKIFSERTAAQLTPIFSTRIQRMVWDLVLDEGTQVECVLDQGTVEHGDLKAQVCEIELELKEGNASALFDFALQLLQDLPLRIGIQSKAQRGYGLFHQAIRKQNGLAAVSSASHARPLRLARKMTVEQAFLAVLGNCVEQIQANDIADQDSHDIERLHQMRVGLRRLRSAFTLFDEVIALPASLATEFEWVSQAIGHARDWDVLATQTLGKLPPQAIGAIDLERVRHAALVEAGKEHAHAVQAVASPRYTALVLQFSRWLLLAGWRDGRDEDAQEALAQTLSRFARQMLRRDERRLNKRGAHLEENDRARHRTRIAAKKMRYDIEFFQALYGEKSSRPYLKALSRLQEQLGLQNDLVVADALLQQLQQKQARLAPSIAYARGYLAGQVKDGHARMHRRWKKWQARELPR